MTIKKRRLNLNLTPQLAEEIKKSARMTNRNMSDVVRLALSLVKIVLDEAKKGKRIYVTNSKGRVLKELILPTIR